MADDPFHSAQSDLESLLQQARPLLTSYLRIRSSASSATSPELVEGRQELEGTLTDLTADLQDLVDSVKAVESDPGRYGLSHAEVDRRRRLVGEVGREVEEMHSQLNTTIQTSDARKGGGGLAHPDSFGAADEDGDPLAGQGDEDDGYGEWEQQRQMEMMHEQDEALDGVFQTVGNLRLQADTMGRELEEQAEMLEDTENIADRVGGKLANGIKKVRHVIEKNEVGLLLEVYLTIMHDERSHPLLQQTALSVNPFIDLPKPPTLPHNYASLPSTLPPSSINAPPAPSHPDHPAYVTSSSGFAAHPSTIITQNQALLEQLDRQRAEASKKVQEWEKGIQERDLAEKRRKAPGWLDSEQHLLQPEKTGADRAREQEGSLMDEPASAGRQEGGGGDGAGRDRTGEDLGAAMDRAFG
ncbi:hypothetical protein KC330_g2338 [Hortaea werneckii]|nr:hypothetical protein KC330_g2338 [Hortaea werneckii]